MESNLSVSKGCFVYKNGFKNEIKNTIKNGSNIENSQVFDDLFISESWYIAYNSMWSSIISKIEEIKMLTTDKVLDKLIQYVKECYNSENTLFVHDIIPCAALLTGVNQPDHVSQFEALKKQLLLDVTDHVAVISSENSSNIKVVVENIVSQFVNKEITNLEYSLDDGHSMKNKNYIKKSHCNFNTLKSWYIENNTSEEKLNIPLKKRKNREFTNQLVIIIPDFENFNSDTLQDLILILGSYIQDLPFVLIFGVATSVSILHRSLPYHVSSKLYIEIFQSYLSIDFLNMILEDVFLSENCPFHLGEKPFTVLIDIFLFYDFSITGFIQGIKYCVMEHYRSSKITILCCPRNSIKDSILQLNDDDLESVRQLPSFRPYVESKKASVRISLLTDNNFFSKKLCKELHKFHDYLTMFHIILKILHLFVKDLPNFPLGKQLREIYIISISNNIIKTPQYEQCMKLLNFQSKEEIIQILNESANLLNNYLETKYKFSKSSPKTPRKIKKVYNEIIAFQKKFENANFQKYKDINEDKLMIDCKENICRNRLKEEIIKAMTKNHQLSEFDETKNNFFEYLTNLFDVYLKPACKLVFNEIFLFNDVYKIKKNIIGTPRASIHTALINPSSYLQCKCCVLSREETILQTMPDLCIAYKLYLECGKLINLYDWLQAFLTIVDSSNDSENDEDRRDVSPELQARFTRMISELQFLGFIKTSKRKTDHVQRLTW